MTPELCKILIAAEISSLCHLNPLHTLLWRQWGIRRKKPRIIIKGTEKTYFWVIKIVFCFYHPPCCLLGFPGNTVIENPSAKAGDAGSMGSIPGSGRSPWVGNGNPVQYSCAENPMDKGAWRFHSLGLQRVGHDWVPEHAHAKDHQSLESVRPLVLPVQLSVFRGWVT